MSATPATTASPATAVALPLRPHTLLGVCEAIGEDFGINSNLIRVPIAAIVLFSPTIAIAVYAVLGVIVLASRLLFPNAKSQVAAAAQKAEAADNQDAELKLAA
jgi:phage shock protein PspC (stress-responsive transcriptional regulator)